MYFQFELKKVFKNKFIFVAAIFFFICNFMIITLNTKNITEDNLRDARLRLAKEVEGNLTKDKVNFITDNYNKLKSEIDKGDFSTQYDPSRYSGYVYGDYNLFREWKNELERIYYFPDENEAFMQQLQKSSHFYDSVGNNRESDKMNRVLLKFKSREIFQIYGFDEIKMYLEYDTSSVFTAFFAVFLAALIFSDKPEMINFLRTTRYGMKGVMKEKWKLLICANLVFCSCIYLEDFISFVFILNIKTFSIPLYYIDIFKNALLNLSILQYIFLGIFAKTFSVISFSMFCAAFFNWKGGTALNMAVCFFFEIILIQSTSNQMAGISYLNPFNLIKLRYLVSTPAYVNLGTISILNVHFILLVNTVILLGLSMVVLLERNYGNGCLFLRTQENTDQT